MRVIACAGEPLNPEAWRWAQTHLAGDGKWGYAVSYTHLDVYKRQAVTFAFPAAGVGLGLGFGLADASAFAALAEGTVFASAASLVPAKTGAIDTATSSELQRCV